jgi:hypothetical protein
MAPPDPAKEKDSSSSPPNEAKDQSQSQAEPIWALAALFVLFLAASSSSASQLNLSPVYGSIPASRFHQRGITATALAALLAKTYLPKWLNRGTRFWLPVLAFWIPVIQFLLFSHSSSLGPVYGPLVTELLTYYPLLFLAMVVSLSIFEGFDMSELNSTIAESLPPVICYIVFSAGKQSVDKYLPRLIGKYVFTTRIGLQTLLASMYTVIAPSKLMLLAMPAVLHTAWMNPHATSESATALLNSTLLQHRYALVDRRDSLTGYISVLQSHENQYQVLRCDHSLLGGDWLVNDITRKRGQIKRETVYPVFTMLESARLVETGRKRSDKESSALFMYNPHYVSTPSSANSTIVASALEQAQKPLWNMASIPR